MDKNTKICQCCGMPLDASTVSEENGDYCKWCLVDGKFTYDDIDVLLEVCVKHMTGDNFTEEQVRAYMSDLLPKLDYWKNRA